MQPVQVLVAAAQRPSVNRFEPGGYLLVQLRLHKFLHKPCHHRPRAPKHHHHNAVRLVAHRLHRGVRSLGALCIRRHCNARIECRLLPAKFPFNERINEKRDASRVPSRRESVLVPRVLLMASYPCVCVCMFMDGLKCMAESAEMNCGRQKHRTSARQHVSTKDNTRRQTPDPYTPIIMQASRAEHVQKGRACERRRAFAPWKMRPATFQTLSGASSQSRRISS